jgi:hypothetical protein
MSFIKRLLIGGVRDFTALRRLRPDVGCLVPCLWFGRYKPMYMVMIKAHGAVALDL